VKSAAASLLSSQGDIQGALKLIQSLPDLDRGGELLLGELYERAGELERAGAVADRLLAQPDVQAVLLAARVAQAKGNTEEADRALGKLNTLGLTPSQQKLAQADYYARSNELPKALALVDEVTKQSPNEGGAWRLKVAIQMSAGDVDGAVKTAESGLTHIKDDRVLAGLVERQDAVRKLMQRWERSRPRRRSRRGLSPCSRRLRGCCWTSGGRRMPRVWRRHWPACCRTRRTPRRCGCRSSWPAAA
jgi:tetratricopeptide (TPR) repeat protein